MNEHVLPIGKCLKRFLGLELVNLVYFSSSIGVIDATALVSTIMSGLHPPPISCDEFLQLSSKLKLV